MANWWEEINTLALVELMLARARQIDADRPGSDAIATLNSHLIGAARQMGILEDAVRDACESDRMLVIYEP